MESAALTRSSMVIWSTRSISARREASAQELRRGQCGLGAGDCMIGVSSRNPDAANREKAVLGLSCLLNDITFLDHFEPMAKTSPEWELPPPY